MFKFRLAFLRLSQQMWPKVTVFAVFAGLAAGLATLVKHWFPDLAVEGIGMATVFDMLRILASSMLAVTTFSLSTMVAASASASSSATPRATSLVRQDAITQNVLAAFLGAFVFSLVGIICLQAGVYDGAGVFILFVMTIVVIALILTALIMWINHLTTLGRLGETTRQVEVKASEAMARRAASPFFGGRALLDIPGVIPPEALEIRLPQYGYLQDVDIEKLQEMADSSRGRVFVTVLPGAFITPQTCLARLDGDFGEEMVKQACAAFVVSDERSFEQDPRFGLCVLAEIAGRALSSAINDWGTAIDVIGRLVRVLAVYAHVEQNPEVRHDCLWVVPTDSGDMFEDAFAALARDGAASFEVQARLQKALRALYATGDPRFMRHSLEQAARAMRWVEQTDMLEEDKRALAELMPKPGLYPPG